jgi:hypothetical protein
MVKRTIALIGLIGGILALVGIFTPWATASGWGMSVTASAWDGIRESAGSYCTVALIGACIALVGALSALAAPRVKVLWAILAIGGILAIAGAAYGFFDIETGTEMGFLYGYGYGLYLTLVGGILALIGALVGGVLALTGSLGPLKW